MAAPVTIKLELDGFSDSVTIRKLTGTEEISKSFNFDLVVEIEPESAASFTPIGMAATLRFTRDNAETNSVTAKVSQCMRLTDKHGDAGNLRYSLRLVPDLWLMGLAEKTKIYIDSTVSTILSDQLGTAGINHEISDLSGTLYREKHLTCQYNESDLNFVTRLMEDRGVFYYFDHEDSSKMIIADNTSYYGSNVEVIDNHAIEPGTWTEVKRMAPTLVKLTGYDYNNPGTEIAGEFSVSEDYDYQIHVNDEPLLDKEEADALAQVRLEQARTMSHYVTFRSYIQTISPGRQFSKDEADYLVTHVHHSYVHEDEAEKESKHVNHYRNTVTAISAETLYRPTISAIKPRAAGTEIAHILNDTDGSEEQELAMIDELGQYTVTLNYVSDSEDPPVSKLRMQQPASGEDDGFYFPLKNGVEVVIGFKKGNPDLPYILGTMPNGAFPSAVNSDNSHHSVIKAKHLLSLQSLGGVHTSYTAKGHDCESHKFQKLTSEGETDRSSGSPEISATHEKSGKFHVSRRYGDKYTYVDGNEFKRSRPGSSTFTFGFDYVENHELAQASDKEKAQGNFDLNSKMRPFNGSWEERQNGFVEKTWGDKVQYQKGRIMFWGQGEGPGDSLQCYNYGTRYTENHVANDSGLARDRNPQHDDGASKVGNKALTVKTFGDTYNYQSGKTSDVLVGDSYSAQYGKITKRIEGDTDFEQIGKVKNKFDGKYEEHYTDTVTIKVEKDVKETLQGKKRQDISGKLEETFKNGRKTTDKGRVEETFEMSTKQTYKDSLTKSVRGGVTEEYKGAQRKITDKMMVSETGAKIRKLEASTYKVDTKMATIKGSIIQIG